MAGRRAWRSSWAGIPRTASSCGERVRVAVVGAGLAGLAAADAILAAGHEPVVLEARGRVHPSRLHRAAGACRPPRARALGQGDALRQARTARGRGAAGRARGGGRGDRRRARGRGVGGKERPRAARRARRRARGTRGDPRPLRGLRRRVGRPDPGRRARAARAGRRPAGAGD
ncbi:MAG: FAD-binding protein, partial [Acidobacteria bacterium]